MGEARSQGRGPCKTHGSLVHNDRLDDQILLVEILGLSVGLGVVEKVEDESDTLLGPSP